MVGLWYVKAGGSAAVVETMTPTSAGGIYITHCGVKVSPSNNSVETFTPMNSLAASEWARAIIDSCGHLHGPVFQYGGARLPHTLQRLAGEHGGDTPKSPVHLHI